MVINEEDRHLRCPDQFFDLGQIRPLLLPRVSAAACLSDPMGLVRNQDVHCVVVSLAVAVEVLELDPASWTDDLPQRLSKGTRTSGVLRVVTVPQEVSHQIDRDDRLPCPGSTLDDQDNLPRVVESSSRE